MKSNRPKCIKEREREQRKRKNCNLIIICIQYVWIFESVVKCLLTITTKNNSHHTNLIKMISFCPFSLVFSWFKFFVIWIEKKKQKNEKKAIKKNLFNRVKSNEMDIELKLKLILIEKKRET